MALSGVGVAFSLGVAGCAAALALKVTPLASKAMAVRHRIARFIFIFISFWLLRPHRLSLRDVANVPSRGAELSSARYFIRRNNTPLFDAGPITKAAVVPAIAA
jgi:hypothetical protein